jgi:hypothetical protein
MKATRTPVLAAVALATLFAGSHAYLAAIPGGTITTPAQCNNVDCRLFHPLPEDGLLFQPNPLFRCVANPSQNIKQCQFISGSTPINASCFTPLNPATCGTCVNMKYQAQQQWFTGLWFWYPTGIDCSVNNYAQCAVGPVTGTAN